MKFSIASVLDLSQQLAQAHATAQPVQEVNLSALDKVLEYAPADLTITVQTGLSLSALQTHLLTHGQWLPIDPPRPETTSLADILHMNLSGPSRFRHGTIREHVLGLRAVLADGRVIYNGGKVVKNVAGYDLCKLLVGSQATLGVIVEVTFKLLPLPEQELFLAWRGLELPEAMRQLDFLLSLPITPVALDVHNLEGETLTIVLALAGTKEDVAFEHAQLKECGFEPIPALRHQDQLDPGRIKCHSILPSRLGELLGSLPAVPWVARAGNGVVYVEGGPAPAPSIRPVELENRIKALFDPKGVLPAPSW